jgi:hypothetical protein
MLRQGIRWVLNTAQDWLNGRAGPLDAWAADYTVNHVYARIMRQGGCFHDYTWGVVQAAHLAKALGIPRVSVLEFGVAGGNGLLALERIAREASTAFGVEIDVFGFDTGAGLPRPQDYRDMPNLWSEGFFPMDPVGLQTRLKRAELLLGPVENTVPQFLNARRAPVAFVSFDVDYYSSTRQALTLFDAEPERLLPRVHCYFDDILGYTFGDHVGERLAIEHFNAAHELRKLSPIYGIRYYVPKRHMNRMWEKQYMAHLFDHPMYSHHDGSIPHGTTMLNLHGG